MLKNYIKTALRLVKKNPVYSFINIAGLAVGMACCLLISLYVLHEISYDTFHQKADRIFRVTYSLDLNGILYEEANIPFPAAEAFINDFHEVEEGVRVYHSIGFPLLQVDDRKYTEERFFFADANFFNVFDFPLVQGDPKTALLQPNHIVLSRAAAQKYFGDDDPIGKVIKYENKFDFLVTGVVENVPKNTHLKFDFLAPLSFQIGLWESETGPDGREKKWFWTAAYTYLQLADAKAAETITAQLPAFITKYFPDRIKAGITLQLQPLQDIHLQSHLADEIEPNGNMLYIYIFSAIAILVLLIASINFVNLTTAKSTNRAKTVSTILIVGIGTIYQQLNFLHGKNLGFDKEQVLFVEARPPVNAKFEAFWEALLKIPGIRKVGGTSNIPGEGMYAYRFIPQDGSADEPKMLPLLLVDYDFFDTMNIAVKQGRGISRLHPSDQEEGFLLNEKAAEQLGWQDDPIGKTMSLFAPGTNEIWKSGSVIGVIENYHFESLHNEVKPLVVTYTPQHFAYRTEIGWQVFALAGGLGLLITILTVSTQSVRAALANPIESLRYE